MMTSMKTTSNPVIVRVLGTAPRNTDRPKGTAELLQRWGRWHSSLQQQRPTYTQGGEGWLSHQGDRQDQQNPHHLDVQNHQDGR